MGGLFAMLGKIFSGAKAAGAKLTAANEWAKRFGSGPDMGQQNVQPPQPMSLLSPPPEVGVTPSLPGPMTPEMMMRWRRMQQQGGPQNFGLTWGDY